MQASSHNAQGVIDRLVNEPMVGTLAPDQQAVLCSMARVAVGNAVAPAPQVDPANHLKSLMCVVNVLRRDSRYRRNVSALSNFMPRYVDLHKKFQ